MLAANNDLVPAVLEELLRLRSTNQGVVRSIDKDVALQGVHFKKGSQLLVNIAAANQDCRRFAKPDSFDLAANRGSHLAFGFGPHHCLGAPLVRAQLQEAITVLVNEAHLPSGDKCSLENRHRPCRSSQTDHRDDVAEMSLKKHNS